MIIELIIVVAMGFIPCKLFDGPSSRVPYEFLTLLVRCGQLWLALFADLTIPCPQSDHPVLQLILEAF